MKIVFINSRNHWLNGWLSSAPKLQTAVDVLRASGFDVSAREISRASELESVLKELPKDTLLWPNAYYTQAENGLIWLQEIIEQYGFPYVGTPVENLKIMLDKVRTHQALANARVPIPQHLSISRHQLDSFEVLLQAANLGWPVVIKPSCESSSEGVVRIDGLEQAREHIVKVFKEFPQSNVLIERFLSSEDVTCGYLELNNQAMLLPTYHMCLNMPGKDHVMKRDLGIPPWTGSYIVMPQVHDQNTLEQLADQMPTLVQALGITSVTRVDARMDDKGILCFFDVNGMPGLTKGVSVLVRQVNECFPSVPQEICYKYLLNTLVMAAALRFNLPFPSILQEQNLFSLEGGNVIRLSKVKQEPALTSVS